MGAVAQRLLYQFTAMGAHLGGIAGVYQDDDSASFCRFADRHADELRPRYVHDAFAHSAPASRSHLLRLKVFKHDQLIAIDQFAAALVGKVRSSVANPLVDLCQERFLFGVFDPILSVLGSILALLYALEVGFIFAIEARVVDLLAIRERGERCKTDIHARDLLRRWQGMRVRLTGKADVPLAGTRTRQRDGLGRTLHRAVHHHMHRADFGEYQSIAFQAHTIAVLRIGDAIVAPELLEARKADFRRTFLHTAKERLERQINPHLNVLQHLGMHQLQRRALGFPARQQRLGIVQPKRSAFGMRVSPRRKRLVVDPPARLKLLLKDAPLAVREIDAVFVGFAHHTFFCCSMYCWTTSSVTAPTVEMNLLRVQSVGRRFLSQGNSFRSSWDVKPLILPTTTLIPARGSTSSRRW